MLHLRILRQRLAKYLCEALLERGLRHVGRAYRRDLRSILDLGREYNPALPIVSLTHGLGLHAIVDGAKRTQLPQYTNLIQVRNMRELSSPLMLL